MKANLAAWAGWTILSRAAAGVIGGYVVVNLLTIAVTNLLRGAGLSGPQVLLSMSIASFPIYSAIILVVYHARDVSRAWLYLAACSVLTGLIALAFG